jgi:Asp-tRNA(Asn)/Glu-tRNA(Gln) amidotransferase A subunit family amidase
MVDTAGFNVESAAFFDEFVRSGRDKQMTNPGRAAGWRPTRLLPGVEYLQGQRVRAMMMARLAEATKDVDVYVVPSGAGGGGGGRGRGAAAGTTGAAAPADGRGAGGPPQQRRASVTQRHFNMANIACYPALAVPNGFAESGSPGSITFHARPFGEAELLAVGKAYQDASGFHLKHPTLA